MAAPLRRLFEWDPMEWSVVERCLLVAVLMFLFGASYWAMGEYFVLVPSHAPYYGAFFRGFQAALLGFVVAWGILIAVGLLLRRARAESRFVLYATIQLYSIGNAVGAFCVGPVTSPHVLVLLGGAIVGLFLFEARVVLLGIASAVLTLIAGSILVAMGVVPYAPVLAAPPYVEGHVSGWWIAQMTAVAVSVGGAATFLYVYLIVRLRDREARLLHMSQTDVLTGVANRRHFLDVFTREFDRAKRYGSPLACVILDMDHFKRINDQHGHLIGDRVLVAAAQAFLRCLRAHDSLARWGGEEFVLLLPQTDLAGAEAVAERCRRSLEEVVVDLDVGRGHDPATVRATVSVGVAAHPQPPAATGEELLKRADEALYRAKHLGRNRVSTLPPPLT